MRSLLPAALVAFSAVLPAQRWSTDSHHAGLTGRVFGLGTWRGNLIAGGYRFQHDGRYLANLARFDGNTWRSIGNGIGDQVRAIAEYQGDLVVAGEFTAAGGVPAASIARWDGTRWQPLGQGLQISYGVAARVFALAVFQGELYAGGDFDIAGGQSIGYLAKWDGSTWSRVGPGMPGPYGTLVRSLLATPTRLYVGGDFQSAGGLPANDVAAWDGSSWSTLGSGVIGGDVRALTEYRGEIYAGGAFGAAGGVSADNIARWDGSQWRPCGSGIPDWAISSAVDSLQVYRGSLYVGGNFVRAGTVSASRVARWDGSQWHGFGGIAGSDLATTAIAMTEWDGELVIGGEFSMGGPGFAVGQPVISTSVVAYDGTRWRQLGRGTGTNGGMRKILPYGSGWVAVGEFTFAGRSLATRVAFFDGIDWQPMGTFDNSVYDAVIHQGDLYVTGRFTSVNGQRISGVARFDGQQWHPVGGGAGGWCIAVYQNQLYAGGTGGVRRWNGSQWETFGPTLFGHVNDMVEFNGRLFIGGSINAFITPGPNLVAWDGRSMTSIGADDIVDSLAVLQGTLLVGGKFSQIGGTPAQRIARWDGSTWLPMPGFPTPGSTVLSFAELEGELYVGGTFTGFGGFPARGLAKLANGTWQPVADGVEGAVFTLCADPLRERLLVGGGFLRVGSGDGFVVRRTGIPARNFAVMDMRPQWADLGQSLPGRGTPKLEVAGDLAGNSVQTFDVSDAPLRSLGVLVLGLSRVDVPLVGGTLVPAADFTGPFRTDGYGAFRFDLPFPAGLLGSGAPLFAQAWLLDPLAPRGATATNAVRQTAP